MRRDLTSRERQIEGRDWLVCSSVVECPVVPDRTAAPDDAGRSRQDVRLADSTPATPRRSSRPKSPSRLENNDAVQLICRTLTQLTS